MKVTNIPSMPTSPMFRTKSESAVPISDLTSRLLGATGLRSNGGSSIGLGVIDPISVKPRVAGLQISSTMC